MHLKWVGIKCVKVYESSHEIVKFETVLKCIGTVESSLLLLGHFFQRKNHLKYLHAYRPLSNLAVLCAKNTAIIFLEDKVRMTMQRWFLSFSYLQKWCLLLNSSRKICSITQCGYLMIFCSLRFDVLKLSLKLSTISTNSNYSWNDMQSEHSAIFPLCHQRS